MCVAEMHSRSGKPVQNLISWNTEKGMCLIELDCHNGQWVELAQDDNDIDMNFD